MNDDPSTERLSFNISHTQNVVVLAIARDRRIGIDAEAVRIDRDALEVARHFFAPPEVEALSGEAPERRDERFVEYWTLKESYIKARGMGLAIPLDSFWFSFDAHERVTLTDTQESADSGWLFWQGRLPAAYIVAICVERFTNSSSPSVRFRQVVPLESDAPIDWSPIRMSP
jgi:4'-phosphopantetheinyl transferase